jgi:hypothetical protein
MKPIDEPEPITPWQVIRPILLGLMFFALMLRFLSYYESHIPIPVGGDIHTNTRTH